MSTSPQRAAGSELIMKLEGAEQEVFVREGLSIGRSTSNIFRISDPGVEHIHARVVRDQQGAYHLRPESPGATILDANDTPCSTIHLHDGTRFKIGSASFSCEQYFSPLARSSSGVAPSIPLCQARCPVCHNDIQGLPLESRQCPRCNRAIFFFKAPTINFSGWLPMQVGPFRLQSFLDNGPVGIQLLGVGADGGAQVVVKLPAYNDASPVHAEQSLAALRNSGDMSHPNIVKMVGANRDIRMIWLAAEWVGGSTLTKILADQIAKRQYLSAGNIVAIAGQAAAGLEFLHGRGIAHGNLQPRTILCAADNLIKLQDYGLPHADSAAPGASVYASPERPDDTDGLFAADAYSFGAVVYELLTYRPPSSPLTATAGIRQDCPAALHSLVSACLNANPRLRPSAKEIADGLRAASENPTLDPFASFADKHRIAAESHAVAENADNTSGAQSHPADQSAEHDSDDDEEGDEDVSQNDVKRKAPRESTAGKPAKTKKRDKRKKKNSRLVLLALLGMFVLGALAVGGAVAYNLLLAPSIAKVDDLLEKGEREKAKTMLTSLAEKHNDTQAMARLGELYWQEEEYGTAMHYLKTPADENVSLAQALMGEMILSGKISGYEQKAGIEYLQKAARDNPLAQYLLGMAYYEGDLVESDPQKALVLLNKASSLGETRADLTLGKINLQGGEDIPPNIEKAVLFLNRAAGRGDGEANEMLSKMYTYGQGVRQDFSKAAGYANKALLLGRDGARDPISYMLFFGKGMSADRSKAIGIARALLEDDPDNGMGNYIIGHALIHGILLNRDPVRGAVHLKKAAVDAGNPFALFEMAEALYHGTYLAQSFETAYQLFTMISESGNSEADRFLGIYYYRGLPPVERDYKQAYAYLSKAEMNKDIEAEAMLGVLRIERHADAKEEKEGWAAVERTARLGSDTANIFLGKIHITGDGVEKDLDKAVSYLQKPALNNPEGRFWLGRARYEKGDHAGAFNDFLLAAERNVPEAHLFLGKMYYLGQEITRDYKQALMHLLRAGSVTDGEAQAMLAKINYFGWAGQRDYVLARGYIEKIPANDNELKLIAADLRYFGLGGMPENREEGLSLLEDLVNDKFPLAMVKMGSILYEGIGVPQDAFRAKRLFEQAAESGSPDAFFMLGRQYHEGVGVARDNALAQVYLERAVAENQMEAKTLLGKMYLTGDGIAHDSIYGVDLLTEASRFGILDAQLFLGDIYIRGAGVSRDANLAASHVKKAAEQGNARARVLFGAALMDPGFKPNPQPEEALAYLEPEAELGDTVALRLLGEAAYREVIPGKFHRSDAIRFFTPAAEKGDVTSIQYLATMYDKGDGVPRDPEKAAAYMLKLTESGDTENLWRLGELYIEKGAGYEEKAFAVFKRLADSGNAHALYRLGVMHEKGLGTAVNPAEAFRCYSDAERKGNIQACAPLGEMYFLGEQTPRDYNKSARLLSRGEQHLSSRGHAMLGWMSYFGMGTEQSNISALKHLEKAVASREPLAAAALAKIYLDGEIVVENYSRALNYAQMSLPANQAITQYVLGRLYSDGLGLGKNPEKGMDYLRQAAERGEINAQYHLGLLYRAKNSDKESASLAYQYIKMAADQGHIQAQRLLSTMTPR